MTSEESSPKFYGPIGTVAITVGVFFTAQVAAFVAIYGLGLAASTNVEAYNSLKSFFADKNPWGQFTFMLLVDAVILRLLWELMRHRSIGFKSLGLNKPKLGHLGYALLGYGVYFLSYVLSILVLSPLLPGLDVRQEQQIGFSKATVGVGLVPIFISLVILPPLIEEIVARGFLFTGLRSRLRFGHAAIVTSIIFAAAHLGGAAKGLLWIAAIDTFILSMVMCYVREKTGSLWPSIGMHVIKNGIAFIVLFNIAQYFK